jgi:hypothetical protein
MNIEPIGIIKSCFRQKFGIPPTITSKALQELEAILSRLSLTERAAFVEKAKGAVERYLASEESFVKKAGYSFQVFVSTMQKYMLKDKELEGIKAKRKETNGKTVEEYEF